MHRERESGDVVTVMRRRRPSSGDKLRRRMAAEGALLALLEIITRRRACGPRARSATVFRRTVTSMSLAWAGGGDNEAKSVDQAAYHVAWRGPGNGSRHLCASVRRVEKSNDARIVGSRQSRDRLEGRVRASRRRRAPRRREVIDPCGMRAVHCGGEIRSRVVFI